MCVCARNRQTDDSDWVGGKSSKWQSGSSDVFLVDTVLRRVVWGVRIWQGIHIKIIFSSSLGNTDQDNVTRDKGGPLSDQRILSSRSLIVDAQSLRSQFIET